MFNSKSNLNAENSILYAAAKLRENINYIKKFELISKIVQHINSCLILNNIYIDNSIIASNIKLNLYIFHCIKSY